MNPQHHNFAWQLSHDHNLNTSLGVSLALTLPLNAVGDALLRIVMTVAVTVLTSLIVGAINRRFMPPPNDPNNTPDVTGRQKALRASQPVAKEPPEGADDA